MRNTLILLIIILVLPTAGAIIYKLCNNEVQIVNSSQNKTVSSQNIAGTNLQSDTPFKILYNNDLVNIVYGAGSWFSPNSSVLTSEEIKSRINGTVDEVSDSGVDAHFFRPGFGHIPFWSSDVYPADEHYKRWESKTGNEASSWGQFMMDQKNHGDMLRVFVDRAIETGQMPFVSLLLNDTHHGMNDMMSEILKSPAEWDPKTEWISEFILNNKNYLIDEEDLRSGLDWSHPEVVSLKQDFIKEILTNYEVDGIELDFMRWPRYFRDEYPLANRIEVISSFLKEVRSYLDDPNMRPENYSENKKRWLAIRIPVHQRIIEEIGIDLSSLESFGVDMVITSSFFFTMQQGIDFSIFRSNLQNTLLYHELHYITWRYSSEVGGPYFARIPSYKQQLYTTANLAYSKGFDGLSLFNFKYYKNTFRQEVPFHIIDSLRNKDWLSEFTDQWYFRSKDWRDSLLPVTFQLGDSKIFLLETELIGETNEDIANFRMIFESKIVGEDWNVTMNGNRLRSLDCNSIQSDKTQEKRFKEMDQILCYSIPKGVVKNGSNKINITNIFSQNDAELLYFDLML